MIFYDAKVNKFDGASPKAFKEIKAAKDLAEYEATEKARHTKLLQLAEEDLAYTIRCNVCYPWFDLTYAGADKWISMRTGKLDKRKKYPEEQDYINLISQLNQALDVEVDMIYALTAVGFDKYEYEMKFSIKDIDAVFYMDIPNLKVMNAEHLIDTQYGMLGLGYIQSMSSYMVLQRSYNLPDFKQTIHDFKPDDTKHISKAEYVAECDKRGWY